MLRGTNGNRIALGTWGLSSRMQHRWQAKAKPAEATEVRLAAVMDTALEKYENDCDYCIPRTLPELVAPSIDLGCLYELMKFALC